MTLPRKDYSQAEQLALQLQVGGCCPRCGGSLFTKKKNNTFKCYELAHIYPLNPSPAEVAELAAEEKLAVDPNDPDNLLPLCPTCHTRFDKPRTADDYRQLIRIKKNALKAQQQREVRAHYELEAALALVIDALAASDGDVHGALLAFEPKRLDDKLDESMPKPMQHKVRHAVQDYYPFIRLRFRDLERSDPNVSNLIYAQVKAFYLKQKALAHSQEAIYHNTTQWFVQRTGSPSPDACELVVAFFIQNCEIFE